jgi:hypothetical protein
MTATKGTPNGKTVAKEHKVTKRAKGSATQRKGTASISGNGTTTGKGVGRVPGGASANLSTGGGHRVKAALPNTYPEDIFGLKDDIRERDEQWSDGDVLRVIAAAIAMTTGLISLGFVFGRW